MKLAPVLALCLLASSPLVDAQIYRCVANGRTVYTDQPCGAQGKAVPIENTPAPALSRSAELQREASLGRVLIGMTPQQVELAWGRPLEKAVEQDSKSTQERWSYTRGGENVAVHFESGAVSKIGRTRATTPAAPAPEPAPATTIGELEERERLAKAADRRFLREGMSQDEVRVRIGPPGERRFRPTNWGWSDCWIYFPAPRDAQTRTTVCFSVDDLRLVSVERDVVREAAKR